MTATYSWTLHIKFTLKDRNIGSTPKLLLQSQCPSNLKILTLQKSISSQPELYIKPLLTPGRPCSVLMTSSHQKSSFHSESPNMDLQWILMLSFLNSVSDFKVVYMPVLQYRKTIISSLLILPWAFHVSCCCLLPFCFRLKDAFVISCRSSGGTFSQLLLIHRALNFSFIFKRQFCQYTVLGWQGPSVVV